HAAPVSTIGPGDTCTCGLAAIDRRTGPFADLEFRSGDLIVFGREERRGFPRGPEGVPGHRSHRARPPARPPQHHGARDRIVMSTTTSSIRARVDALDWPAALT